MTAGGLFDQTLSGLNLTVLRAILSCCLEAEVQLTELLRVKYALLTNIDFSG